MSPTRREILAASAGVGVCAGLAGCSGRASPDTDGNDESGRTRKQVFDEVIEVPEDEYWYAPIEVPQPRTFQYEFVVREGPAVDVWLMEDAEFDQYQGNNRFRYSESGSAPDSAGAEVEVELPTGEYVLVADNTEKGPAEPPANFDGDVARIDLEAYLIR